MRLESKYNILEKIEFFKCIEIMLIRKEWNNCIKFLIKY